MELTCPHCAARYVVPADAVPLEGRTMQCAKCGQSWHQPGVNEAEAHAESAGANAWAHAGPLGEGVPDVGAVMVEPIGDVALPNGPAAGASPAHAWEEEPEPRRGGLGTIGWILLLLVIALIALGGYAYWAGLLKLPA